jgi:hypothetical protein
MASRAPAKRRLIEGTLAGLRFVRNRVGYGTDHADFIELRKGSSAARYAPITAWKWKSLQEPDLGALEPRRQAWEMTRYQAYQAQLAGRTVGATFGQASAFLVLVSANAIPSRISASMPAHGTP